MPRPATGTIVTRKTGLGPRYEVRYPDQTGVRRSYYLPKGSGRRDAEHLLTRLRAGLPARETVKAKDRPPTVSEWCNQWLDTRIPAGVDPVTVQSFFRPSLRRLMPHLGDRLLPDLRREHVQDAAYALAGTYKPSTIRKSIETLRAALNEALDRELITRNPALRLRLAPIPPRERVGMTATRAQAILAATAETEIAGLVLLGCLYGLRVSEALGILWSNVQGDTLHIRGQLAPGGTYKPRTKGKRSRDLPLLPAVVAQLRRERARQAEARLRLGGWPAHDFVFTQASGQPWRRQHVGARLRALTGVTFHQLRHGSEDLLRKVGVPEKVRMQIHGHLSSQVHGLYGDVDQEEMRAALEAVERVLDG